MLLVSAVAILVFNSFAHANLQADKSMLVPIIMLLLDDDSARVNLKVGAQISRTVNSTTHSDGVSLAFRTIFEDVELSLTMQGIGSQDSLAVYVNDVYVADLKNGLNTFSLARNLGGETIVEIRSNNHPNAAWSLVSGVALISDPLRGPKSLAESQRFLTRATFGARLQDMTRLMEVGYEQWLDGQLAIPYTNTLNFMDTAVSDRLKNRRLRLISEGETNPDLLNSNFLGRGQESVSRLDSWFHAAINGQDQLRQRVAFALSQILVVGDERGDSGNRNRAYAHYHDVLARNAFGNYRTLLGDVTINPAMAQWLSLRGSQRVGRPGRLRSRPDENYAREVQQLFTIGLVMLDMDGTPILGADDRPIETYTPTLVGEFARIFTGWMWVQRPTGGPIDGWETTPLTPWGGEPNAFHDRGEKTLHSYPGAAPFVPAGLTVREDLNLAMDNLFYHPNVAPFISKQLIQRLVTSNPSKDYVRRVAEVFQNTNGVKGDLAAVVKAILLDPEALTSHEREAGGKLKEPIIKITQLWRTFNAKSTGRYVRFSLVERSTGQRPIGSTTVFNFYPPNYSPSGAFEDRDLVSPEMLLVSDGLLVSQLNKLGSLVFAQDRGTTHPLYSSSFELPMVLNLGEAKHLTNNLPALMDFMDERLFGGLMSDGLRNVVIEYLNDLSISTSQDEGRTEIVQEALILLTASPEYNVQR